jgi:hypothetical protein
MRFLFVSAIVAFAVIVAGQDLESQDPEAAKGLGLVTPAERVDDPEPKDYELIEDSASASKFPGFISTLDLFDRRFQNYQPPGEGDCKLAPICGLIFSCSQPSFWAPQPIACSATDLAPALAFPRTVILLKHCS